MKKLLYIACLLCIVGFVSSCSKLHDINQQDDPATEYSPVYPLSGEWYVRYGIDGTVLTDYSLLFTYNTANNDVDKLWISDGGHLGSGNAAFWSYCVKSSCNVADKTFSGQDLVSTADWEGAPYAIKINVTNGKVIVGGAKSTSGVVTDSIYVELEFEDDPGTIYQCAGWRKTGFLEDEH